MVCMGRRCDGINGQFISILALTLTAFLPSSDPFLGVVCTLARVKSEIDMHIASRLLDSEKYLSTLTSSPTIVDRHQHNRPAELRKMEW
jgi:hypothetical protein